MYIYQMHTEDMVNLDISFEFPDGLSVYDIKLNRKKNWEDPDDLFVNVISGPE